MRPARSSVEYSPVARDHHHDHDVEGNDVEERPQHEVEGARNRVAHRVDRVPDEGTQRRDAGDLVPFGPRGRLGGVDVAAGQIAVIVVL